MATFPNPFSREKPTQRPSYIHPDVFYGPSGNTSQSPMDVAMANRPSGQVPEGSTLSKLGGGSDFTTDQNNLIRQNQLDSTRSGFQPSAMTPFERQIQSGYQSLMSPDAMRLQKRNTLGGMARAGEAARREFEGFVQQGGFGGMDSSIAGAGKRMLESNLTGQTGQTLAGLEGQQAQQLANVLPGADAFAEGIRARGDFELDRVNTFIDAQIKSARESGDQAALQFWNDKKAEVAEEIGIDFQAVQAKSEAEITSDFIKTANENANDPNLTEEQRAYWQQVADAAGGLGDDTDFEETEWGSYDKTTGNFTGYDANGNSVEFTAADFIIGSEKDGFSYINPIPQNQSQIISILKKKGVAWEKLNDEQKGAMVLQAIDAIKKRDVEAQATGGGDVTADDLAANDPRLYDLAIEGDIDAVNKIVSSGRWDIITQAPIDSILYQEAIKTLPTKVGTSSWGDRDTHGIYHDRSKEFSNIPSRITADGKILSYSRKGYGDYQETGGVGGLWENRERRQYVDYVDQDGNSYRYWA